MCEVVRFGYPDWAIATVRAAIKTGDKLFCTKREMVPSFSHAEQWTYKCFVIFYRLLRYADNPSDTPRSFARSVCLCDGVCVRAAVKGMCDVRMYLVFTMQRVQFARTIKLAGATQLTNGATYPACARVPCMRTPAIYKMERYTMCCMALWLCTKRQNPIDASDDSNNNDEKNSEKHWFLLHIQLG